MTVHRWLVVHLRLVVCRLAVHLWVVVGGHVVGVLLIDRRASSHARTVRVRLPHSKDWLRHQAISFNDHFALHGVSKRSELGIRVGWFFVYDFNQGRELTSMIRYTIFSR